MSYKKAMKGHEITYLLRQSGSGVKKIAAKLGISQPAVTKAIYNKCPMLRIKQAVADAIGKPVSELWPDAQKNTHPPENNTDGSVGADTSIVSGGGVVLQGDLVDHS